MFSGLAPEISRPCQITLPEVGANKPASRLRSVVFPDPFGPRMPTISPFSIRSETSDTATRPPKRLVRASTSRNMAPTREQADDAARHDENGKDQDRAVGSGPELGGELDDVRQA